MLTDHRKALLMNRIRTALEQLQREGVGYIDTEYATVFHYRIDGVLFVIDVSARKDADCNG